ncbi:206_t:CDS:2, partial [Acaulospora colombiana]
PDPDTPPRIWWCTTGSLTFLPIHAAGIYDSHTDDAQLSSYAISSYTPTLSALLQPSKFTSNSSFKVLSVIEASPPGATYIPNAELELEHIRRHFADKHHLVLEGPEATRPRVTEEMKECNWLHLACHGVQNASRPTKSALLLDDGHLTLEEIIKLSLPKAEFAFLSACQTTAGDEQLSEEAVHIAGGMLLAGYRGVVATMWSIQDELAPEVADEFYAHLLREGGRPDSKKAAEALHISIQRLRKKQNLPLTAWVPFVHLAEWNASGRHWLIDFLTSALPPPHWEETVKPLPIYHKILDVSRSSKRKFYLQHPTDMR